MKYVLVESGHTYCVGCCFLGNSRCQKPSQYFTCTKVNSDHTLGYIYKKQSLSSNIKLI
jgi:hypothetical protein